ncbi:MAG: BRO family protein [Lachnospiraceae bacterium]|nr:BRO family protein [Lachnospiraceae bacterium]
MNELQIFSNEEFGQVRTIEIEGKIYFVGIDIAKALGYSNPSKAVIQHCKGVTKLGIPSKGGKQETNCIPEGDLYRLITHSELSSAERFECWVFDEVLPSLRQTGHYEMPKSKTQSERLASVNNAVKILTPMLKAAGCNSKIQLLTAKSLYEKAGVEIPVQIEADNQYFDTVHIARKVGLYYQSSGKPADKAINEIIRRLDIPESMYTETWESKGNWQGTVRKYTPEVILMVKNWYAENGYPTDIEYTQCDGTRKSYHVIWHGAEVA